MHFKIFRIVTVALLISGGILTNLVQASELEDSDDHRAISAVIEAIDADIAKNNLEAALTYFDGENQEFLDKISIDIGNMLKLEELEYGRRITGVEVMDNTATAVIFEKKSYSKYERGHTDVAWQTIGFVRRKTEWKVSSIADRDYFQPSFTDLSIELHPDNHHLTAVARLALTVTQGGEDNLILSLNRGLSIDSITLANGEELSFERSNLAVVIPWPSLLAGNEALSINVVFSGNFFNEFEEVGYSLVNVGPEGCFANFVTHWYPQVNGRLTKTLGRIAYTVPEELTVASIGRLATQGVVGDRTTYVYDVTSAMDFTFNANRFFHQSKVVDGVQVNVFFLSGGQEKADLYSTKAMEIISYSKEIYGIFPFDSYSISEVPPEITGELGGSGGQGLNFYPRGGLNEETFNFPLIAHESGHMWWGSWVLSKDDPMIDEGFSQLNAVLNIRHFLGEKAMWDFIKNGTAEYPQSARLYFTFFGNGRNDAPIGVYDEDQKTELNRLAYTKAFVVYAMLMEEVGHETFMRGIRRIVDEYGNQYFDLKAFREIMEGESQQDLGVFFDQWFHRTGAPEFDLEFKVTPDGEAFSVTGKITQLRELYSVNAEVVLVFGDERLIKKVLVTENVTNFTFVAPNKPTAVVFDPNYKILRWTEEFKAGSLLGESRRLNHEGKPEQALQVLSDFVETYPDNREGLFRLAATLITLERHEEAKSHLETVVNNYNDESFTMADWFVPLSHLELAKVFEQLGDETKAEQHYERVLDYPNVDSSHQAATKAMKAD